MTQPEQNDSDYASIVREHGAKIYNAVYCVLGNATDAEDVTQEAFLKAFRALQGFKGEASVATWLYRIAMNAANDHLRKNKRYARMREPLEGVELKLADQSDGPFENPESAFFKKERTETIKKALAKLPAKFRPVIVLKDIEGLSYKEIGSILGISIGTVESRLFRAREMLRKELTRVSN